ncbi:MAG TPA: hypothetical protein VE988_29505 [Gemmataceae bacterium]|nr:hypothetical protein [Gemmataceae bacterium]
MRRILRLLVHARRPRLSLEGMRAANQITLIGADLVEHFGQEVPADVTRLDHYCRELEI